MGCWPLGGQWCLCVYTGGFSEALLMVPTEVVQVSDPSSRTRSMTALYTRILAWRWRFSKSLFLSLEKSLLIQLRREKIETETHLFLCLCEY